MPVQLDPQLNVDVAYAEDSYSDYSNTSGTGSYASLKVANTHGKTSIQQKEEKKYYKKKTVEEGIRLVADWKKPFVLDEAALQQISAGREKTTRKRDMQLKKDYRSQEYKRAAFRIMDEFFGRPEGKVFRLSGNTKKATLTVQMIGVDAVKQGELVDDQAIDKMMQLENTVDGTALRQLDEIKKKTIRR